MKEEYNGFEIHFDVKEEYWFTLIEGQRIHDKSLKALKEYLDKLKRNKFERLSVFVRADRYMIGRGQDPKYIPCYTQATVTSVAPNGNAYVVSKGEKSAKSHGLRYSTELIEDTPQNRLLIAEFEKQAEIEFDAEKEQEKLRKKFKRVDGAKLYKKVYGKDL